MNFEDLLIFLFAEEPWREQAACRDEPVETFFPGRGQSKRRALAICARCPVTSECSDYAERSRSDHGIWGGKMRHSTGGARHVPNTDVA